MHDTQSGTAAPGARWAAPDRVAVVVNGNAKGVTDDLVQILDQIVQSGDLLVSRSLEEGREIARMIVERGYPTVITGGGDGTFTQMVTFVVKEADRQGRPVPRFGLLRLGTGNALAWVLGARAERGKGALADLARVRTEGSRELRLLDVEGTLSPFAGLGIDATALTHFREMKGAFERAPVLHRFATGGVAYVTSIVGRTMPEYLFRPHPRVRIVNEGGEALRLGVDGQPVGRPGEAGEVIFEGPSRMVAMSTIPYWGFGARIFPFANDRDDKFSLRIADISPLDVALHIRGLWKGTYRSDKVHDFLVDRIRIEYESPMPLQIGGDPVGRRTTVEAALSHRPIRVVDYYAPPPVEQ
ncbi:MAG: diacylglycerol/lipid kinase family protein [Myxococcota bacterium]